MFIKKLLDPKIDYVFKRLFGYEGNEDITKDFITSIIDKDITSLKLDSNPILEKDLLDDKVGILDIKAKIDGNVNCNIEIQVVDSKNIEKRLLFYWSKMYSKSIKSGKNYSQLEKTIVILISDYELDSLKEIPKYITKWNIREEEYHKIILTDVMEICIIELPKFGKYKNDSSKVFLNLWIKFIENPEVITMNESNKMVSKAKKVLEEISSNEREQYLAELREKYIMDQKAIEDAGFDKGVEQGLRQGIEKGKKNATIEFAKKLKKDNVDINMISKYTGLTIEEICNLN